MLFFYLAEKTDEFMENGTTKDKHKKTDAMVFDTSTPVRKYTSS